VRLARLLALRHLRLRPLRAALAVLAVAAGSAMAVSLFVVRSSAATSVTEFARSLSGPTELRVVGPVRRGGLEPSVVAAVEATDGVARAVPMVQGVTVLDEPAGEAGTPGGTAGGGTSRTATVLGVDCRVEQLVGDIGCTPGDVADVGDRPLAVGPGVDPGARVRTSSSVVPVSDVPVLEELGSLGDGRVVVFGLPTAQRLFERDGRLDVVYVAPDPGVDVGRLRDRLAAAVGEQNAVLDADRGPPEVTRVLDNALPMFTLIAVFALGIGAMLVHNTAALSLEERRRHLAVVGALGGSPRMLAATTLGEAAVLGGAGGVLGAAGGVVVAGPIVASLSTYTERVAGIPLEVHLTWVGMAAAVVLGLVVSVLAAAGPVRRALRADVAAELSGRERRDHVAPASHVRSAAVWGTVSLAGLVAVRLGTRDGGIEPWQVPAGALGFGVLTLAVILLGAKLAPLGLRPIGRLVGASAPGRLAVANLAREPRRTSTMVVAVAASSTVAFMTAGYVSGARQGIAGDVDDWLDGVQVRVVDEGANVNLDTGMSPELLGVLDDVPGAEPVSGLSAGVLTGARPGDVVFVAAYQDPDFDDDDPLRGTIDMAAFARGEAVVNTALARPTGLRPGDTLRLPTPTGTLALPVQAVVAGGGVSDRGAVIPYDLFARHFPVPPSRTVTVEPAAGTTIDELDDAVTAAVDEAAASGRLPEARVRVLTPDEVAAEETEAVARQLAPFWTLQRVLLVVSFVAVLSTLLLVGMQRRREMGMLGAVGMEPGVLARMVLAEAGLVGVLGVVLTGTGGVILLWALNRVTPLLAGFDNPLAPDWWSLPVWGGVSTAVALVAALWPARRAARTEVVAALHYE
jgi:putative ABC transport system permease protein